MSKSWSPSRCIWSLHFLDNLTLFLWLFLNHIHLCKKKRCWESYEITNCRLDGQLLTFEANVYMHKILPEQGQKNCWTIETPHHKMKEVIKKEILEWLVDVGIIYPIVDSSWVSLIQCVPKKGGISVVPNQNNDWSLLE